jgi:pilus assembly protein CpaB
MRRGRIFFYLAFVLIIGLVAVLLVYQRFIVPAQQASQATPTPPPVEVVVVTANVAKGTPLTEDLLGTMVWVQGGVVPQGMYTGDQLEDLVGRVVKLDLTAQTPVMDSMLLTEGDTLKMDGSPWALNIDPGMVAVSIPVNKLTAVSFAPRPGDHVDVIATIQFIDVDPDFQSLLPNFTSLVIAGGPPNPVTMQNDPLTVEIFSGIEGKTVIDPVLGQAVYVYPGSYQRPRMTSQMVMQDAVVLQMGDFPLVGQQLQPAATETAPPEEGTTEATPAPVVIPQVVTLIVRPQDAVALNYLMLRGSFLTLALRGANYTDRYQINPVTLQYLLEQYQIPVPVRLPYDVEPPVELLPPGLATPTPGG